MIIPLDKIQEGILISLRKCEEHLSAAELLIQKDFANDAVALVEFALEELGRAVVLRDKLKDRNENIENELFTSHPFKYNKAWSILPEDLKTIYLSSHGPLFELVVNHSVFGFHLAEKTRGFP